jgi:hypothetical protein
MKYCLFIIFIFLYVTPSICGIAKDGDSTLTILSDNLLINNHDSSEDGLKLIATCGLGMTTGSTWDFWENDFSIGPVSGLGMELYSPDYHLAFQLYGHSWFCKNNSNYHPNQHNNEYFKLSDRFYSQFGLSPIIKYYIGKKNWRFKMSFYLGFLILKPSSDHAGLDFGFDFYYSINEHWTVNLSRRMNLGHPDPGGSSKDVPNLLILNFCYLIKEIK